jgi:hypothetical protein
MKTLNIFKDGELLRSFLVDQIFTAPTYTAISGLGWQGEDLGNRGLFLLGPLSKIPDGWRVERRAKDDPKREYTLTDGAKDPGDRRPDRAASWLGFQYGGLVEYGAPDPGELLP